MDIQYFCYICTEQFGSELEKQKHLETTHHVSVYKKIIIIIILYILILLLF